MVSNSLELSQNYDGRKGASGRKSAAIRTKRQLSRESLDRAIKRIGQLIDHEQASIALESSKWVIEQIIGRAPVRSSEGKNSKPSVDNRIQFAIQNLIAPKLEGKTTLEVESKRLPNPDPSSREGPPDE